MQGIKIGVAAQRGEKDFVQLSEPDPHRAFCVERRETKKKEVKTYGRNESRIGNGVDT